MGKVTWEGWQTDANKAAQPATGVVIPFNPRRQEKNSSAATISLRSSILSIL